MAAVEAVAEFLRRCYRGCPRPNRRCSHRSRTRSRSGVKRRYPASICAFVSRVYLGKAIQLVLSNISRSPSLHARVEIERERRRIHVGTVEVRPLEGIDLVFVDGEVRILGDRRREHGDHGCSESRKLTRWYPPRSTWPSRSVSPGRGIPSTGLNHMYHRSQSVTSTLVLPSVAVNEGSRP